MARAKVEQVLCDRCKRDEFRPLPDKQVEKLTADFEAVLEGMDAEGKPVQLVLKFQDLCVGCKKALFNLWEKLREWDRDGKELIVAKGPLQATPPLQAPELQTPPRPHAPVHAPKVKAS